MNDKYEAMSDSELSGEVLKAIYGDVVDYWCASDCGEYIYDCGPTGDQFYKINLIDINNWNDIRPIAVEHKISLNWRDVGGERWGADVNTIIVKDKSPQRALAICFLKLKDAQNEPRPNSIHA